MQSIKAIETRYKGYLFRSRLEARWAVFFDALGLRWEYEPQGFVVDGTPYLPDFFIYGHCYKSGQPYPEGNPPTPGYWVEIKPVALTDREQDLCRGLSVGTGHVVYALAGSVGGEEFECYKWHPSLPQWGGLQTRSSDEDDRRIFHNWFCSGFLFYICTQLIDGDWLGRAELERAFRAARSARFEHGQSGATIGDHPPAWDGQMAAFRASVLALLNKQPGRPVSAGDLQRHALCPDDLRAQFRKLLVRMADQGVIERVSAGVYRLPPSAGGDF